MFGLYGAPDMRGRSPHLVRETLPTLIYFLTNRLVSNTFSFGIDAHDSCLIHVTRVLMCWIYPSRGLIFLSEIKLILNLPNTQLHSLWPCVRQIVPGEVAPT
jgi:hypothetical protein